MGDEGIAGPARGTVRTMRDVGAGNHSDEDRSVDRRPVLPFLPGEVSNGEFVPRGPTPRDRAIEALTLRLAESAAAKLRMDRRRFLHSAGGLAAMLSVVNLACSSDGANQGQSSTTTTSGPGGTFDVPDPTDTAACESVLGSQGEFIVDVHTHHVMPDGPWRQHAPETVVEIQRLVPDGCTEADPLQCLDRVAYVEHIFLGSDTTVAMLSDVPNSGPTDAPMPFADNVGTHEFVAALTAGGPPRALVQSVIAPNFSPVDGYLDVMSEHVATGTVRSFKTYTAWGPGGQGYALDDPAIGLPVIEHARAEGIDVMCAHKGLPLARFDLTRNGPRDLVAAAAQFPDVQFVVYHSAFERETTEGPYDPERAERGTNSLVRALDDVGIPPNANVWCELGTTWREVMSNPTEAAHVLGKLLTRVGEDRVLWGTDAIWFGSPQPQIMAFRAFEIAPEFQEGFGYPALTPELKAKVFGRNAATLLGLDAAADYCTIGQARLDEARAAYTSLVDDGVVREPWRPHGPLTRREVLGWLRRPGATTAPF